MEHVAPEPLPLSSYQARKESARCTVEGCRRKACDRSSRCLKHYRAHKRADRAWRQRQRDARRAAGECIDCPPDRIARATEGSSRCLACRVKRRGLRASDGGVGQGVDPDRSTQIAAATRKHADGRVRYHGQQKRGQQPKAQLNLQDLRHARQDFDGMAAGLELLAEQGQDLHRGERERVEGATASLGERASGRIDDILERLGHFKLRHGRREGDK